MKSLKVRVWDVKHGTCISAETPNGKNVIIDCGNSDGVSPACHINPGAEKKILDYLVISHPHQDHIKDILNVDEKFDAKVLRVNSKITKNAMKQDNSGVFDPDDEYINKYYEYAEKRFPDTVSYDESPRNPLWGDDCMFYSFSNNDGDLSVNNLSVATFIEFGNQVILYGADLEKEGWNELLKQEKFCKHLSKVTIFIASHHGNDSGYCSEIFEYFTPTITIVSAGKYRDNTISKYDKLATGMTVYKPNGDKDDCRKVLTTRKDGNMDLILYPSADPKITIGVELTAP